MLLVVSMVTFDTLGTSLIAPISYLLLMSSVHLVVPFIVRWRLLLNPVAIFVGIIFLGWIGAYPVRCWRCRSSQASKPFASASDLSTRLPPSLRPRACAARARQGLQIGLRHGSPPPSSRPAKARAGDRKKLGASICYDPG